MFNGSDFNMWYMGENVTGGNWVAIGYATSPDGINWVKHASPVLQLGPRGAWDSYYIYTRSVIWNGTEYLMYYTGLGPGTPTSLGVAFSKDMVHWQKYQDNPILTPGPGAYDNASVKLASVIYDPPLYKMWYVGRYTGGYPYSIGYATSTDGVHWIKYLGNPVITKATIPPSTVSGPTLPSVIKVGSLYTAALEYDYGVVLATSSDGVSWSSNGVPIFNASEGDSPSLTAHGNSLYVWYDSIFSLNASEPKKIGFAFCAENPLVLTTTETATVISPSITTVVSTSLQETTLIQSSTMTTIVQSSSDLQVYQASTGVLVILVLFLTYMVLRRRM
jgi:hypothetical protein